MFCVRCVAGIGGNFIYLSLNKSSAKYARLPGRAFNIFDVDLRNSLQCYLLMTKDILTSVASVVHVIIVNKHWVTCAKPGAICLVHIWCLSSRCVFSINK
jgi:hypothetical protein